MPVRQALLTLEREGLVKTDAWRGSVVASLDPDTIRDMYTFRGILEGHVARALAEGGDFDAAEVRDLIAAGRKATMRGDYPRLIELDVQFHTRLYDAFGNRALLDVMRGQWIHIRRLMALTLRVAEYRRLVWDQHASIVEAIEAGDTEQAGALAEHHNTAAAEMVIKRLTSAHDSSTDE
jgi:DNA-binding GntR family transcriptional regulator